MAEPTEEHEAVALEAAYRSKDPKQIVAAERKHVATTGRGLPASHRCIYPICRAEIRRS